MHTTLLVANEVYVILIQIYTQQVYMYRTGTAHAGFSEYWPCQVAEIFD